MRDFQIGDKVKLSPAALASSTCNALPTNKLIPIFTKGVVLVQVTGIEVWFKADIGSGNIKYYLNKKYVTLCPTRKTCI